MKLKLIVLVLGLGALLQFSSVLQAGECRINHIEELEEEIVFSYDVNDMPIIITLERGISYRIYAYVDGDKKNTFKEGFISSSEICFSSSLTACKAIFSFDNDTLINTFLENRFCEE